MSKHTVVLRLSVSNKNDREFTKFIDELQKIVERASARGFEVIISSDGSDVAVWTDYDRNTHISESDVDPEMLPYIKASLRPCGVCGGAFIYRKDSIAMMRVQLLPSIRAIEPLSI